MIVTAALLLDQLSVGLYRDLWACLLELVKNGLVASMPNGKWDPTRGDIEIFLRAHPLGGKDPSLITLDHGRGLTPVDMERYCGAVGRRLGDTTDTHAGAAQKGIGRLAAMALNRLCRPGSGSYEERAQNGFFVLTRTSPSGPVTMLALTPAKVESFPGERLLPNIRTVVDPGARELGFLKGTTGTFTAVVVPNPAFESADEIRDGLRWMLPRKPGQAFRISVDGQSLSAPPMFDKRTDSFGDFELYLDLLKNQPKGTPGGIWLCDAETGFRVGPLVQLLSLKGGSKADVYPLQRTDALVGDLFVPTMLRHQNSGRDGIHPDFCNRTNQLWKKLGMYLATQAAPVCKEVIGETDTFTNRGAKILSDLVEALETAFGKVEGGPFDVPGDGRPKPPRPEPGPGGQEKPPRPDSPDGGGESKPHKPRTRGSCVRIGDKEYVLLKGMSLSPRILAMVDPSSRAGGRQIIHVNTDGYSSMPGTQERRRERVMVEVFHAVAGQHYPDDPRAQSEMVGELCERMLAKK